MAALSREMREEIKDKAENFVGLIQNGFFTEVQVGADGVIWLVVDGSVAEDSEDKTGFDTSFIIANLEFVS